MPAGDSNAARLAGLHDSDVSNDTNALALFSTPTREWFVNRFGAPTPPQSAGWPVIAQGDDALILSPTGSGKTLTAFLWSLDRLFRELRETPEPVKGHPSPEYVPGIRVVYVSPLKALNNDIERNLQIPLTGIRELARANGDMVPLPRVAVRTGDTPSAERQRMLRTPPHILITTPESLYLMLTADRARALFGTTYTVIVDEIHTLVGTKRGAHLALTLERLALLANQRLQRIGLSATIQPIENAARFLGGQDHARNLAPRPVTIVDARYRKPMDLRVLSPVSDFHDLPGHTVWPVVIPMISELIEQHRTTLIFSNSRRLAERTADRLNEYRLARHVGTEETLAMRRPRNNGIFAAGIDASQLAEVGLAPIRAHHGSMSRTARLEMEHDLKSGTLPALVATSSLELGIDIGDIDLVVQLQSPKSVASGLQRVGRSGHLVGQTSVGRIIATFAEDVMEAAAVARGMLRGDVEQTATPENPLDILAQHIVAMVASQDWIYDDLYLIVRAAFPFRNLGEASFRTVLDMLSGKYPESVSRHLHARISWDRVNNRLAALPGTRLLAIQSGGTIPDRGMFSVVLSDRKTRIGELDEEFVFEIRVGDTFLMGSQVWRAIGLTDERMIVEPAPGETPRMPFWRGDAAWRPFDLGRRIGAFRRTVADLLQAMSPADFSTIDRLSGAEFDSIGRPSQPANSPNAPEAFRLVSFLRDECALDRNGILQIIGHVSGQVAAMGAIASDRTIVVELFSDLLGEPRMVIQSPFGGRVNGPWAIALASAIKERYGVDCQPHSGDDGVLLRFANAETDVPADLVREMTSAEARERLINALPGSAVFGAQFRMNAARALLLTRNAGRGRTPLWLNRLRAKDLLQAVQQFDDFPIVLETYRDCLRDVMDLDGLTEVLDEIQNRTIEVVVHDGGIPSPVAVALDQRFASQYMYEFDAPRGEQQIAALSTNRALLAELLQDGKLAELLKPSAMSDVAARVAHTTLETRARTREELATLLFDIGDLSDVEIAERVVTDQPGAWIEELARSNRIVNIAIGSEMRWVMTERTADYARLHTAPASILRRWLRHNGPTPLADLACRYGLTPDVTRQALSELGDEVLSGRFRPDGVEEWIDRRNLEQMHRRTLALLRQEVQPVPLARYAAFLARWQGVESTPKPDDLSLSRTLQQLRGIAIPGIIWERDILPARVGGFDGGALSDRLADGEIMWVAEGGKDPRRARVQFFFRGEGGFFLPRQPDPTVIESLGKDASAVYQLLTKEGAALMADIEDGVDLDRASVRAALVELVLDGLVTNDTLEALRAVIGYEPGPTDQPRRGVVSSLAADLAARLPTDRPRPLTRHRLREARQHARARVMAALRPASAAWVGRWSLVHRTSLLGRVLSDDERSMRQARLLLARWGVVTRAALERESNEFSWHVLYPALSTLEMRGEARRGYFVSELPGIQFARPDAIEMLRSVPKPLEPPHVIVLSAADPAQIYGTETAGGELRFSRVATTAVVAIDGLPVAVMSDGGSNVDGLVDHPAFASALRALASWWSSRSTGRIKVERWRDELVTASSVIADLETAGFVREYGGMTWTGNQGVGTRTAT